MIPNRKANHKKLLLKENPRLTKLTIRELSESCNKNVWTIKQEQCCVTLTTVENMLIKFCTGIQEMLPYLASNSENKVYFGPLLPCRLSEQVNKISKGTSQSLFAKLTAKSPIAKPCTEISAQKGASANTTTKATRTAPNKRFNEQNKL